MVHDSHSARSRGIGLGSWGSVTFTFVRALLGALAVPAEDGAFRVRSCIFFKVLAAVVAVFAVIENSYACPPR